ncbi:MAG: hypothetical protein IJK01_09205 [Clostridia bacterium]|nr:hypothetical protein [Clostridia bacterium]
MNQKKVSVGAWVACVAAVLTLAALIVYSVNISAAGYFKNASVANLVLFSILAICALVVAIATGLFKLNGVGGKVLDLVGGCCQIVAVVLITFCLINLIAARVEGLGFIYFSNADVILEVQTPENLASATGTIASMVCYGVAMLASIVSAFLTIRKQEA